MLLGAGSLDFLDFLDFLESLEFLGFLESLEFLELLDNPSAGWGCLRASRKHRGRTNVRPREYALKLSAIISGLMLSAISAD